MREEELKIDRSCHAVYTKQCRDVILRSISGHYAPDEANAVFERVQHQFEKYLADFEHRDLGGSKNFHNGVGGTYDCIMLVCYYVVCREKISFAEIQKITESMFAKPFGKLKFVNIDKPFFKHLMYAAFRNAGKRCEKWHDYEMHLDPYSKDKPLHYCFTSCPFADFVHQFGMEEIAGALCNVDYAAMEAMNVKLVRRHTCIEGNECDYTFYAPGDPYLKEHPEYVDEQGFIRNR